MAGVPGPKPKPSSIPGPIPGRADAPPEATGVDVRLNAPQSSSSSAAAAPDFAAMDAIVGGDGPSPTPGAKPVDIAAMDAIVGGVDENAPPADEMPIDEAARGGAGFAARAASSLGRTPEEQRALMQRVLGEKYETKYDDKERLVFRVKGKDKWQLADPSIFETAGMIVDRFRSGDVSGALKLSVQAAQDLKSDYKADFLGDLINIGATLGLEVVGTFAAGPVGFVAGTAAGGAAGSALRGALVRGMGVSSELNESREAATNAAINVATAGLGAIGGKVLKGAFNLLDDAVRGSTQSRIAQSSKIREGVDEIQKHFGYSELSPADVGGLARSTIEDGRDKLIKQIGLVEKKAVDMARAKGDPILPAEKFIERAQDVLTKAGVKFDPMGRAKLPEDLSTLRAFGEPGSGSLVEIAELYNEALKGGGFDMKRMFNTIDLLQGKSRFDKAMLRSGEASSEFKRLTGALVEDRNAVLPQILKGTPEGELAQSAYKEFADNAAILKDLGKRTLRIGSPEKFADALIAPKELNKALAAKALLGGDDGPAFNAVRAAWFEKLLSQSIDKETGLFVGRALEKQFARYGDDVVNAMLGPEQVARLRHLAERQNKINIAGLVKDPAKMELLVRATLTSMKGTDSKFRVLWEIFSKDREALRELTERGALTIAKRIKDPVGRTEFVQALDMLREAASLSRPVIMRDGRKALEMPIPHALFAAAFNANRRMDDETDAEFAQRRLDTIEEIKRAAWEPAPTRHDPPAKAKQPKPKAVSWRGVLGPLLEP